MLNISEDQNDKNITLNEKNIEQECTELNNKVVKSISKISNIGINEKNNLIFDNSNIIKISSKLSNLEQIPINAQQFSLFYSNCIKNSFEPIIAAKKQMVEIISQQLSPLQEVVGKITESLSSLITSELKANMFKITSYFYDLAKAYKEAEDNPRSLLNWMNYSEKISEYIWTIPYDMTSEELKDLFTIVESEKEFDKYMIKYFNKNKVSELYDEIILKLSKKHQIMFNQIKASFDSKNYALANVGMLSIIDELCSKFLFNKGRSNRKDIFLPLIEELDKSSDIFEVIPVMILNSNINVIYESIDFNKRIAIKTNKKVRRNPSQHGQYFSNKKIDSLMLLNTIYNLLVVSETYKQYLGRIIYVKTKYEFEQADTRYSNELNRFYFRKRYVRKK